MSWFNIWPLPLVLSVGTTLKSLAPSPSLSPIRCLSIHMDRIPLNLLFARLNSPSLLSLPSRERCSSTLVVFVALCWTQSYISCTEELRTGQSSLYLHLSGRISLAILLLRWLSSSWTTPLLPQQGLVKDSFLSSEWSYFFRYKKMYLKGSWAGFAPDIYLKSQLRFQCLQTFNLLRSKAGKTNLVTCWRQAIRLSELVLVRMVVTGYIQNSSSAFQFLTPVGYYADTVIQEILMICIMIVRLYLRKNVCINHITFFVKLSQFLRYS